VFDLEELFPASLGPVIKTAAVAEGLGITRNGVLRLARRGLLPAPLKLSRKLYLWDRVALVRALRARRGAAHAPA
jgi:hypothetical protein